TLAIFNVFLAKITNQEAIIVGTPIAGRRHLDLQGIIGIFINMLALRNYPKGNSSFMEFLIQLKDRTLAAYDNQNYPFEDLVRNIDMERDLSRNPLFDVAFESTNVTDLPADSSRMEENMESLKLKPYTFENKTSKFDLSLYTFEKEEEILFNFEYCTKLFKKETIERFCRYFKNIISAVIENAEGKISAAEILSAKEKEQLLFDFNNTSKTVVRDKTYSQLFEETAAGNPTRIAARYGEQRITYGDLDKEAQSIANHLSRRGVTTGTIVAIYLKRSITMLASIIGIFKAGGAYLPIDVEYPGSRIAYILENSETPVVIKGKEVEMPELGNKTAPHILELDENRENALLLKDETTEKSYTGIDRNTGNPAYMIYTSGTTGNPKGALLHQQGMLNHLYAEINELSVTAGDIIAQTASACFDISVWQFLTALLVGGRTDIIAKATILEPQKFLEELREGEVTILQSVPSLMTVLLEATALLEDNSLEKLRWMLSIGEPMTV
ncbi:MAG: AMP-binding protein, partial [bacterium]|nr:AMP-binding protein [bacterium]